MIRHWSHTRQKGWGYPPKKTACQSGLRFQRYKPLKSVTTAGGPAGRRAGRPLILRFLVYISRNSLRASRSLVIKHACSRRFYSYVGFAPRNFFIFVSWEHYHQLSITVIIERDATQSRKTFLLNRILAILHNTLHHQSPTQTSWMFYFPHITVSASWTYGTAGNGATDAAVGLRVMRARQKIERQAHDACQQ